MCAATLLLPVSALPWRLPAREGRILCEGGLEMRSITTLARRSALAALVAASLGFGAARALAAPGAPDEARACNPNGCDRACRAQGAIEGRCNNGLCLCLF